MHDSLPVTSFKVESAPCVQPEQVSFSSSTQTLPNEVMQSQMCQKEPNTGKTIDTRYRAARGFHQSEKEIMQENGIFERLYRQKLEQYIQWGELDLLGMRGWLTP